jgi:hypothetical protein
LFNRDTRSAARVASADICDGSPFTPGEKVYLRLLNNKLAAQRDLVAEFAPPPAEFVEHAQAGPGIG